MNLMDAVNKLREAGFTDQKLAELCQCKRQTIYYIRTGKTKNPHYNLAREIERLSQAL